MNKTGRPSHGYRWVIVAACTIILLVSFGIYYSFSVFFSSLQAEFRWTRAETASVFSLYLISSGIFSVICGQALDRLGPRIVVIVMGAATGVSLMLISRVEAAWQLYLWYGVVLALGTGPMYIIAMGTVSRWVVDRKGTATGIVGAGAALGTVIFSPISAWLISNYDWRQAYVVIGVIAMVVTIPAGLLLKKSPPESIRLDGDRSSAPGQRPVDQAAVDNVPLKEIVKTDNFKIFFLIWFCYSFCLHLVMGHIVPKAQDSGMQPLQAAAVMSVLTAFVIPCRLISGVIADRVSKKHLFAVLAGVHLFLMSWLMVADQAWMLFVFAGLYGLAYGAIDPPVISMVGDAFGVAKLGATMGLLMVAWGLGSAAGPYFGGFVYDHTAGYGIAFTTAGVLMGIAAVCGLRIK